MKGKQTYGNLKSKIDELQGQNEFLTVKKTDDRKNKESRYRLLFEKSLTGFAYCKLIFENDIPVDFIYLEVNPAFEKLTGLSNVVNRKLTEVVPGIKENYPRLFLEYAILAAGGESQKFDFFYTPLNIWLAVSVICPEKDYFVVFFDDITERMFALQQSKNKNDELLAAKSLVEENERKFRSFFNDDLTGDFIMTVDGILLDCNPSFLEIFGFENKSEIVGKEITTLYNDISEFETIKSELKKNRIIRDYETSRKRKNGDLIYIIENKAATFDINGEITEIKGYVYDITERKLAEQALKESEELLQVITDNVQAYITIVNKNYEYIFVNQKAAEYFGKSKGDILNKKSVEIIGEKAFEKGYNYVTIALKGETVTYENQVINGEGINQYLQICATPYFQNNKIAGALILAVDITGIKQAELLIQQQNNELVQLNNDKDRFISILAHDLRSPFNGILGLLDLLISNFKEYDIKTIEMQLSLVQKSANQAFNLLNDLLNWAIAKSSKQIFNPDQLNIYEICEEVKNNIKELSNAKGIEVKNLVKKDILVTADADMLKTIIRNLVLNAVKFTDTLGKIEINAVKNNDKILISIRDTGVGIEKERLQKLFSIDEINTTRGTKGEKGSGLGLLLCKEFVEKHGGKIWAESEPGKGSEFKFTLQKNEN